MKKYDEYKDSGVAWIGDVPKHWEVKKMNYHCSTITDFVASGSFADLKRNVQYLGEPDYAMLIRTVDLSSNDKKQPPVYISKSSYEFLSNSNLVGGEIILPNIGAVGNVYIVPKLYKHMSLAPNAIMVRSYGNDKFLYYYFKSKPGVDSLTLIGKSTVQDKFNKTELRSLRVLVPPVTEQVAIAAYLDTHCAKIDNLISIQQKRIALLQELKQSVITHAVTKGLNPNVEMKQSGVEWIGDVPKHWEYCRFKDFMLLQTTASNSNNKIGLENIESRSGRFIYTGSEFEGNGIEFSNQDIIYGKLRPYLQKVWLATFDGNAVGDFFVFRMKSNSCPSFVKYLMLSDGYTKETDGSTIGAKMPRVSSDFILTIPVGGINLVHT